MVHKRCGTGSSLIRVTVSVVWSVEGFGEKHCCYSFRSRGQGCLLPTRTQIHVFTLTPAPISDCLKAMCFFLHCPVTFGHPNGMETTREVKNVSFSF